MKRLSAIMISLALMFCLAAAYAETAPAEEAVRTPGPAARFASVEEGQELMRGRTLYHRQINEANLAFLLQMEDADERKHLHPVVCMQRLREGPVLQERHACPHLSRTAGKERP